jgi:hypothetical protein
MATRPNKSQTKMQAKKPTKKKVVAAKVSEAAVRGGPTPESAPAPVLVNSVKPDERLTKPDERLTESAQVAVESAVDTLEKTLKAALPVARKVNHKLVDIAQTNMNSGLELARDLAGAKSPIEAMRLSMHYWHEHMGILEAQAQELRTLSAELVATASAPIRAQIRRT